MAVVRSREVLLKAWKSLSFTDKILPLAIILAIVLGVLLSVYVPKSRDAFDGVQIVGVSVPLAVGMIVMMIPPLCKVEWERMHILLRQKRYINHILISLLLNWIVAPFLMFGLSWLTLFDESEYRIGIIMIGLARCIAMVMVWNEIAGGDHNLCAILVVINSVLQIVLYAPYQMFFCYVITADSGNMVSYSLIAQSVAFFLGVPLGVGLLARFTFLITKGGDFYKSKILPIVSPFAFIGLIYTIIVIFIQRGNEFIKEIGDAFRCFVPLILYFLICWFGTFFGLRRIFGNVKPNLEGYYKKVEITTIGDDEDHETDSKSEEKTVLCGCEKEIAENANSSIDGNNCGACSADYGEIITQTFTTASNNFELSLAIAISIYGSGSKQSIAATFGPLLEVPILLILCLVAQYLHYRLMWRTPVSEPSN